MNRVTAGACDKVDRCVHSLALCGSVYGGSDALQRALAKEWEGGKVILFVMFSDEFKLLCRSVCSGVCIYIYKWKYSVCDRRNSPHWASHCKEPNVSRRYVSFVCASVIIQR